MEFTLFTIQTLTRAPHVGALYTRRMSRSKNKSLNSAFIYSSTARLCRKTESQSDFHLWHQNQYGSSMDGGQPRNQLWCLMLNCFQIIEQIWFFAYNATVTLTFDQLVSTYVGSSNDCDKSFYQVQWITRKLFKILSGHSFSIKCYSDLDLSPKDE